MEAQSFSHHLTDDEDSYQSDLMDLVDHIAPPSGVRPTGLSTELFGSSDRTNLGYNSFRTTPTRTERAQKLDKKRSAASSQASKNGTDKQKRKTKRSSLPYKNVHSDGPPKCAINAHWRRTPSSLHGQTEMTVIHPRRVGSDSWFPQISSVRAPVAKMRFGSQEQPSMDLPSAMQLARSVSVPDPGLHTNSLKRMYSLHNRRPHEVHRAAVERLTSRGAAPVGDRGQLAFGVVRLLSEEQMLKQEDGAILSGGVGKRNVYKGRSMDGYYEKGSLEELEKKARLAHECKQGGNKTRRCFTD